MSIWLTLRKLSYSFHFFSGMNTHNWSRKYVVNNALTLSTALSTLAFHTAGRTTGFKITSNAKYTIVNTTREVCFQGIDKTIITEYHRVNKSKKKHIAFVMFVSLQKNKDREQSGKSAVRHAVREQSAATVRSRKQNTNSVYKSMILFTLMSVWRFFLLQCGMNNVLQE